MGINRNVSRAIVFGPKHLGGISLSHLHTLQGIRRLQYFIGHIAKTNSYMRVSYSTRGRYFRTFPLYSTLYPWSLHSHFHVGTQVMVISRTFQRCYYSRKLMDTFSPTSSRSSYHGLCHNLHSYQR
jgi:hypothetical protein